MGISVAEYLGLRTDVGGAISPVTTRSEEPCPFRNFHCAKLKKGQVPVCSVRKTDGTLYIVCEHRLCSTKKDISLKVYQQNTLHLVAKEIFSSAIPKDEVLVKREYGMAVGQGSTYKADYVMIANPSSIVLSGPSRVVLEMQGGGETSNTKVMTTHVRDWEGDLSRTNSKLREELLKMGTLETNAWRRQQEQFMVKGNIAIQSTQGTGIAFCMGSTIWDYLYRKVESAGLRDLRGHNWTLAMLAFSEDTSSSLTPGPIPLTLDPDRKLYTNYHAFVRALTDQGIPDPGLFSGNFVDLHGVARTI